MATSQLRVLIVGAHPDDPDIKAGGTAIKYADRGHDVRFVTLTNGDAGHHELGGAELARRRRQEAQAAADVAGITYDVMDNKDGELAPTLENRKALIRLIRDYNPDLLLTHRPNDYHPDHRYTSQLVQDSAYMVTVPNVCSETPILETDPVIAYLSDGFRKPYPFDPDVVISIDDCIHEKMEMLHQHESQVYEWLPFNEGHLDTVPETEENRREWLRTQYLPLFREIADRFREQLCAQSGAKGDEIEYAEAFEICEYGRPLTAENRETLFEPLRTES